MNTELKKKTQKRLTVKQIDSNTYCIFKEGGGVGGGGAKKKK